MSGPPGHRPGAQPRGEPIRVVGHRLEARPLENATNVWQLTAGQVEQLYRTRHMNSYVHAALLTIKLGSWPRGGCWQLRPGEWPEQIETVVNHLLAFVPQLGAGDAPTNRRVELTLRLYELYRLLPALTEEQVSRMMQLLASLAFLPLVAEQQDGIKVWLHPPVRTIDSLMRRELAVAAEPFDYDEIVEQFEDIFRKRGIDLDQPIRILFAVTIELVRVVIVAMENGVFPEITTRAFRNIERAMRQFESRHGLGNDPLMPLDVSNPGQVRYRNTLYLYGGNLLERTGRHDEARSWYLRDIDSYALPSRLGFFMTALKTCERLLSAYRVTPAVDRPALLPMIHRALAASLSRTRKYAETLAAILEDHPELDLSSRDILLGDRKVFFSSEPCREPLLVALLYQNMVRGIGYGELSYHLFVSP